MNLKYRKKAKIVLVFLCVAVFMSACASKPERSSGEQELLKEIIKENKETYHVGQEEFEFYEALYKKDVKEEANEQDLKKMISKYHAEFYLAKQLGVRKDDSFQGLKEEWEKENESRKEKKKNGEVFYGPEKFEFSTYFEYIYSNMRIANVQMLSEKATADMEKEAEKYYEQHKEDYGTLKEIKCLLSDGKEEEEKILTYNEIRSLQKTDDELMQFLLSAKQGEVIERQKGDRTVKVEFLSSSVEQKSFEEIKSMVMRDYVGQECYEKLISEIEAENSLLFEE